MYILKPIPAAQGVGMAAPSGFANLPTVDRLTVATLPVNPAPGSIAIVTDGTATPTQSGIIPVGGGSLQNLVWADPLGTWWVI